MAFADELNHFGRKFMCGWSARPESPYEIARRVQSMANGLERAEPTLGELWPAFEGRAPRPTDPGPVQAMSGEDLGRLIDRRGRFDPPRLPAPVGPDGYAFSLGSSRGLEGFIRSHVFAGATRPESHNSADLELEVGCSLWRDPARGVAVLQALVAAWKPHWAWALATIIGPEEDASAQMEVRPWLLWRRAGAPPPLNEADFVAEPAVIQPLGEGELRIWP